MIKILADAGTSWTKLMELFEEDYQLDNSPVEELLVEQAVSSMIQDCTDKEGNKYKGRISLFPTKLINQLNGIQFDAATGHMSSRRIKESGKYENELVAMALGGMKMIQEPDVTLVDLGSRDSKWIQYVNYKYKDLDWNGTCGSGTGATIEMVCNFYGLEPNLLPVEKEKIAVTCGVFGMEKIMDQVARGLPAEIAISRYIHGIAFNVWNFARCPEKLYLSGGLCLNTCFVESLKQYCNVDILGRYVLLEGLY
jgi:activator of 2-hydroxyglutaryl-CoA dehydratase